MKILVNSCINKTNRINMSVSRKSCVAGHREREGIYLANSDELLTLKKAVEDSKCCNNAASCERL